MYLINIKKMIICILFVLGAIFVQAQSFTISGTVTTIAGNPLDQVEVSAERPEGTYTTMTDQDGNYSIEIPIDDPTNMSTIFSLKRTTNMQEGVSFRDLIKLRKLILGITTVPDWQPWQTVALDTNNSGLDMNNGIFPDNILDGITTLDLVEINKIILNLNDSYNSSWRFFDEGQTQVNTIEITGIDSINNANFIGVKIGNIDCQ